MDTYKRSARLVGPCILIAITTWVWAGAVRNPFQFDDHLFLESPQVTSPSPPWFLFSPGQPRPITFLSFHLNFRAGGTNPSGYHLVNVALHVVNTALLYFFATLFVRVAPETLDAVFRRWWPLAAAAFFGLHPIQSEPVNYAYQRATLLAGFFSLLALILFLRGSFSPRRAIHWAFGAAALALATASKESALVLPALWAAWVWTNWNTGSKGEWRGKGRKAAFAATMAFLFLVVTGALFARVLPQLASAGRYLAAQVQVLATYLRMLLWPSGLSIDHDFRPAPFYSPYALACAALLAFLILLLAGARRRRPSAAFLGASFLLLLAPTSSIIPSPDLIFEHRLYLPMIAASILAPWGAYSLIRGIAGGLRAEPSAGRAQAGGVAPDQPADRPGCAAAWAACMIVILTACGAVSRHRTWVWGDSVRLWSDAAGKAPAKARVRYNLGIALLPIDHRKARDEFLTSLALAPSAPALYNLGWIAQISGDREEARRQYEQALKLDGGFWRARHQLGNLAVLDGNPVEAENRFRQTVEARPDYWPAWQSLVTMLIAQGRAAEAHRALDRLKVIQPELLEARFLRAYLLATERRASEAEEELRFIEARDPRGTYRDRIAGIRRSF